MSVHVALNHRTTYRYARPVALGPQVVRLRPAPHCRTRVLSYALKVSGGPHFVNWLQDPQANHLARLVFPERVGALSIEVDLVLEFAAYNPFDFFLEPGAVSFPFEYDADLALELAPYRKLEPAGPLVEALVAGISRAPRPTNDFIVAQNRAVAELVAYRIRLEPGLQSPEETLSLGSGSCRDSAWLLVQVLRRLGLAARFVSGYLVQLAPDEKPLEGPAGPEADFVDLHAWCEVYLPGAGWVGLDPTSGLFAGEGHLPLACTAEPSAAAPVTGSVEACETEFSHAMSIARVLETPRVTKPYAPETWERVLEVGRAVDAELVASDVRLTMGGEPTFVAAGDPDGAEWNTAALGPKKRELATELFFRLRDRYAPKGLVHFGEGKWYPGEPLPRWSLNLYWRNDGEPLWGDAALVADPRTPARADAALAGRFLEGVAGRLAIDPNRVFPAYEDVHYYLWRERRLPVNVGPEDPRLDDPLERERLRRLFSAGIGKVAGHVLPVAKPEGASRWRSGPWHFRDGRCFLAPGDSPIGLRLPLDARPWIAPEDREESAPPDPAQPTLPLPPREALRSAAEARQVEGEKGSPADRVPARGESASWTTRTAMCAEARGGVLYVFMPPAATLDDYVELVAAVELTAEALGAPVVLEGYPPPRDARIEQLSVTPDPGVVEVNIHPSSSWDELVLRTTHLYEDARASGLVAEKFLLDGRHVGTGGGNHVVLGGRTPADSPFLRRPDLLRSLVAYFHEHPSLSFLFSGLFIGPTSQAPRVDEARHDSVYELEIAFRELTRKARETGDDALPPPWLVDRLFRDLLVDVTGNTHRAEFCIDKLFSPDGAAGRHGLLELRGLEMPPHARMSLAEQLLLRALVARFWRAPFDPPRLARWGTELHDRFMLPHFVWQDFEDVIAESRAAGYALASEWFLPHFEFRFPKYGDFEARGARVELRAALEPWHVLGEDAAGGGTARYVDSSLERLEVRASGMLPGRYALTCNGIALPLRPTGARGEFVCGVRYRAWQPPRCLHPHIGVHAPLTFDLVDTFTERSLGGCAYHVTHPGGRTHEARPVNALEAEGRRRARFFRDTHSAGPLRPREAPPNPDFPFTLDLRAAGAPAS